MPREAVRNPATEAKSNKNNTAIEKPPTPLPPENHKTTNDGKNTQPKEHATNSTNNIVTIGQNGSTKDIWDRLAIVATLIVAALTVALAYIAWIQAQAAMKSAQAVINTERPWFAVIIEPIKTDQWIFHIKVVNKGRTPGILNDMFSETIFHEQPDNLPLPPNYKTPCFGPNDSFFQPDRECVEQYEFSPVRMIDEHRKSPNHSQTSLLIIYGKVTYADTFNRRITHETRWCYFWDECRSDWSRCGPKDYSGHSDH